MHITGYLAQSMLFCYLDESGNTGSRLDDPNQPRHYLVAVMVREDRVSLLSERLDKLSTKAPTNSDLVEYHGQELFSGEGPWEGVEPYVRVREYSKALSVISEVGAQIAYASINKPALAERGARMSPHLYALQFLTEKIEAWVRSMSDPLCQLALLVADQNHQEEEYAFDLVREMHRSGGPVGASWGLAKTTGHVVDSVYFTPSERSRGIQLADLVAFVLNRRDRDQESASSGKSVQAVKRMKENYISPHVVTWRERWPGSGVWEN